MSIKFRCCILLCNITLAFSVILPTAKAVEFTSVVLSMNGQPVQLTTAPKINDEGQVVAGVKVPGAYYYAAATWDTSGAVHFLPDTFGNTTNALAINNSGTIVGWGVGLSASAGPLSGFTSSINGPTTFYPLTSQNPYYVAPGGINDSGVVVANTGSSVTTFGSGVNRFQQFSAEVTPMAINNSTQTTGYYHPPDAYPDSTQQGMFFDDGETVHYFENIHGCQDVRGSDINNRGVIAGTAQLTAPQQAAIVAAGGTIGQSMWAFTCDKGQFSWLNPLDGSASDAGVAVNDMGWVTGASIDDYGPIATLWINGAAMDLNSLVSDLPPDLFLLSATDVNNNGQILAVAQDEFANRYIVRLTPTTPVPEASSVASVGLGGMALLARRGRRLPA